MMIDDRECIAAGGARLQWHKITIADIDLIARNGFADPERLNGAMGRANMAGSEPDRRVAAKCSGERDGNRANTVVKALKRYAWRKKTVDRR